MLVRRAPTPGDLERLEGLLDRRSRVFLQGEGVGWAVGGALPERLVGAADWEVCVGSWRRRHRDDPAPPFRLGSLAGWLDALLPEGADSPELVSLGRGDGG